MGHERRRALNTFWGDPLVELPLPATQKELRMNREQKRQATKQIKKQASSNPLNILWVSNSPWASTGYGQQTKQVTSRLVNDNHKVAIAANYGLEASSTFFGTGKNQIKIYPRGYDQWSNDVIPAHMQDWSLENPHNPSVIMTLFDVWVFRGPKWAEFPVASWTPIDHMPTPLGVLNWLKNKFVKPIAMSKYGLNLIQAENVDALYVPHAIEAVFKPTTETEINGQKYTGREIMGVPDDAFVVGMNAANKGVMPNRKAFGENLLAFSIFAKDKKDVCLYLHTDPKGAAGGINLLELLKAVGIPQEKVRFADTYALRSGLSQDSLAAVYTSMNVLLATSYGEGFGIPTIEAQACGTKVIVSNFAASAELCGDGWLIDGQPLWDAPQGSFFYVPSVPQITDALEQAYKGSQEKSSKAIDFAKQYQANSVYEKDWKPAIEAIRNHAAEYAVARLKGS